MSTPSASDTPSAPPSPHSLTIEQLSDPAVTANPYPYYAALRSQSPLYGYRDLPPGTIPGTDEAPRSWAILSHEQVVQVAKAPELFSSRDPLQEASGAPTLMLVNHDDPEHRALRQRVQGFFTRSAIEPKNEWLAAHCHALVAELAGTETDVMQGIAADLPAMVMTRMLDMPESDYPLFRRWATAFMLSAPLTPEERSASNDEMLAYFVDKVQQRAATPSARDDFISLLLRVDGEQRALTVEEVIRFCFTLVVAGAETTTGLIGNLFWVAATQSEAFARLRADETLMDSFLEETLRFAGPPQRLFRIATEDVVVGDETIRKGDWVAVFFAAANHDPAVWPEPEKFLLGRDYARNHFSFGHGVHSCLGSMLVRMEAKAVLGAMRALLSAVEEVPDGFKRQQATQLSYALESCRVRLRPA